MGDSNVEFLDMKPREMDFREEVIRGLTSSPKKIPPRFFYDAHGSELFEKITTTDAYYVTKAEEEILSTQGDDISSVIGSGATMIELGSGNSHKTVTLISSLRSPSAYVLIDISAESVRTSAKRLSKMFPGMRIISVCADYLGIDHLPGVDQESRKVIVFLGSTIGNMDLERARDFMHNISEKMDKGDGMLVGVDLQKDEEVLSTAYNDPEGYTAQFNLNLLNRIRRELHSNIDSRDFVHRAFYNREKSRIEMHLQSVRHHDVTVDGVSIHFSKGETIHTENSYKYSVEGFRDLAGDAGFTIEKYWTDSREYFALFYIKKVIE